MVSSTPLSLHSGPSLIYSPVILVHHRHLSRLPRHALPVPVCRSHPERHYFIYLVLGLDRALIYSTFRLLSAPGIQGLFSKSSWAVTACSTMGMAGSRMIKDGGFILMYYKVYYHTHKTCSESECIFRARAWLLLSRLPDTLNAPYLGGYRAGIAGQMVAVMA
jgi:hypothetical protein